jgi:sulfur relay (sulfurtransferase) DsrC/TusE family protein
MKKVLIITRNPIVHTRQMRNTDGRSDDGRYQFFINQIDEQPDFVVVNSKGLRQDTTFPVPRQQCILLTDEPYSVLAYPRKYYRQFGTVVTCQQQIKETHDTHVVHMQPLLPWYVGMTWEPDHSNRVIMTYSDIEHALPKKQKLISVVSSYKAFSKGHMQRRLFVDKLVEHYGDKIDVFGEGIRDFRDKWDVVAPYQYQIAIENCQDTDYWTEKLADCFLANTYPIYHGCPNVGDYFPSHAFTTIDINRFEQAVETIDRVIAQNLHQQRQKELSEAKQLVLDRYNLFNCLANICDQIAAETVSGSTLLQPASRFFSLHNFWLYSVSRTFYKIKFNLTRNSQTAKEKEDLCL